MAMKMDIKNIETEKWHFIIHTMQREGWNLIEEYDEFDKGIEYDLIRLEFDDEELLFVWDDEDLGGIKCDDDTRVEHLQEKFGLKN